jgi:hypothetical protein
VPTTGAERSTRGGGGARQGAAAPLLENDPCREGKERGKKTKNSFTRAHKRKRDTKGESGVDVGGTAQAMMTDLRCGSPGG